MFYSPQENKVFVLTNVIFLEIDSKTNYKPRDKVVLEELFFDQIRPQQIIVIERQCEETTYLNQKNLHLDIVGG